MATLHDLIDARHQPALVPAGRIDMGLITSLCERMEREGTAVQAQRMRYDRRYALERIALAHGSADLGLRGLALTLFELYTASH